MRLPRILTGLIALALLGLVPVGLGTPSSATAPSTARRTVEQVAAAPSARALPKRKITSKIVDEGNVLTFRGNVSPGHARKKVFVQRKNCKHERCDWHKYKVVQTNKRGGFHCRVPAPRDGYWYWRAKVRKHGGYATSYSDVWRTYTI